MNFLFKEDDKVLVTTRGDKFYDKIGVIRGRVKDEDKWYYRVTFGKTKTNWLYRERELTKV